MKRRSHPLKDPSWTMEKRAAEIHERILEGMKIMKKVKLNPSQLVVTEEFVEMIAKVLTYFKGDIKKTRGWLVTPNPQLGTAPLKLMMMGRGHKVIQFIDTAADEGGWKPREWELEFSTSGNEGSGDGAHVWAYEGPMLKPDEKVRVREIK
jgi:hypothetical protein